MTRYKAVVSYDGSCFGGWQKQPNTNSVQEEIETALQMMHKHPVDIVASGRTDAGVHAIAQVFHFDSEMEVLPGNWERALNSLLPKSIRMQSVVPTSDDFHARFYAVKKRYDYLITNDVLNPFLENYMGKERYALDLAYMQECANVLLGTHDFTSFTSNKIDPRKPRVKTITRLEVLQEQDHIRIIYEGNGFLRYMVRMLTQTLIEAGKHRLTKEEVQAMLEAKDKHACRYKAQAQGLYLTKVYYEGDD